MKVGRYEWKGAQGAVLIRRSYSPKVAIVHSYGKLSLKPSTEESMLFFMKAATELCLSSNFTEKQKGSYVK
jgi:hypothetical protein